MATSTGTGHEPLGIAVWGAGNWGRNWVRVAANCDCAELKWVIDLNSQARDRARSIAPQARTSSHIDAILDEVEAVVICTPAWDHPRHVAQALNAGKHVLVEKPIAMRHDHARQLQQMAAAQRRILMVGHQLLFHPAFVRLWSMIRQDQLGPLQSIRARRSGAIDFNREANVLWTYGPHDVAMILALSGSNPRLVDVTHAEFNGRQILTAAELQLGFADGWSAEIELTVTEASRIRRLAITGERGRAVFDDSTRGGRLFLLDCEPSTGPSQEVAIPRDEPLMLEFLHFINSVKQGEEPTTGPDHAAGVTRVLESASTLLANPSRSINGVV